MRDTKKTLIAQIAEYAIYRDTTARQQAEDLLRHTEEELRQAKKMEAIGQLAGGLAHDFNNLLTAIIGYSDLLLEETGPDDPRRDSIEEIHKAADRAASMTRQLLAFSRKQILQWRVLDLNALIADMSKMLRRLLGEDIDLVTVLEAAPSRIEADPVQIQQVILNLSINARDAMPRGGALTIRTANRVGPVGHVVVAVSDTGAGIDAETQSHIFEPFFTTKGPGKGTGLGLSTVYGIVQQSGGSIEVESEPGRGTTFRIYLPVRQQAADPIEARARIAPAHGPATILVVDDEAQVSGLVSRVLRNTGYTVLEARDGEEALRLCERHPGPIDVLLSDIVMLGMSGPQLLGRVSRQRPEIKVVYISGYPDQDVARYGVLEGTPIIKKPFIRDELVTKIEQVLKGA